VFFQGNSPYSPKGNLIGANLPFRYGSALPDFRVFRGEPSDLRSQTGIISEAASWRSRGIIQTGLIVLIATPVLRVACCLFAFFRQRDRLYVLVTLFVLTLLLTSLAGGMK
jgi:uncharacterized membrane protein